MRKNIEFSRVLGNFSVFGKILKIKKTVAKPFRVCYTLYDFGFGNCQKVHFLTVPFLTNKDISHVELSFFLKITH